MAEKPYRWKEGATLEPHSRRKHKILAEYFAAYLATRCQHRKQLRFRLAIIDGFAGAGRYRCGTAGSPLIFIQELARATASINARRAVKNFEPIQIECLLIFNDADRDAVELLKENVTPVVTEATDGNGLLYLRIEYLNQPFEETYPAIKLMLSQGRYGNVLFNLDQCGYRWVERDTLIDIMRSYPSAEIFYTFAIQTLITFLHQQDPSRLLRQLQPYGIAAGDLEELGGGISKASWLGGAERLVFHTFMACAPFSSPFSIHNPEGWRYWFIHFANSYKARQVYNNVLHGNSSMQAHFGHSGLNMLTYNPRDDGALYLFDADGRVHAREALLADIPRLISGSGDVMGLVDFYENIYNSTPSHTDDIHQAIIANPDVQVITPGGGERRTPHSIRPGDVLKLKPQASFHFPAFLNAHKQP